MRILIVDAFSGSKTGRAAFRDYEGLVRSSFKTLEVQEEGSAQFIVRSFTRGLEEFCYDNEVAEFASKGAIAAVDKLDFVFIDGDCRLLPWHARTRKLAILVRTILGAKKCLFAAGPGAYMVAYVCATGGKTLRVLNGNGQGGSLLDVAALRPENLGGTNGIPRRNGKGKEVVLDSATGDFYIFDAKSDRWLAEGNVGILKTGARLGGIAAAILADACGNVEGYGNERTVTVADLLVKKRESQGAADINTKALDRPNTPRFQSEVLVRMRPKGIQHRMFTHVKRGEYLAWSPGAWNLGERAATRCRRGFKVLAASTRAGPEVIEVGNCLATRYNLRRSYEDSVRLLSAFVDHKCAIIRESNRVDRSSAFVLNGNVGNPDDGAGSVGDDASTSKIAATTSLRCGNGRASKRRLRTRGSVRRRVGGEPDTVTVSTDKTREPMSVWRPPAPIMGKPRFAPPESTRAIRAGKKAQAPSQRARSVAHGPDHSREIVCDADGRMRDAAFNGSAAQASGATVRAVDSAGRRRILMGRMGESIGLDLSPTINALLLEQRNCQHVNPREAYEGQLDTARTAPAAPGRRPEGNIRESGTESGNREWIQDENDPDRHWCKSQDQDHRVEHPVDGDNSIGFGNDGEEWRDNDDDKRQAVVAAKFSRNSRPEQSRSGTVAAGRRRFRDAPNAVRVPGHDRRKPYSSFRRFEKMADETRGRFFSIACDSDSIYADAARGKSNVAGQQRSGEREPHTSSTAPQQPRFSATFVDVEAWPVSKNYGVATEGPYYGKCGGRPGESGSEYSLFLGAKGWTRVGSKTRAWAAIGECNVRVK